jgi:N-acetylglucosamine kinase-like BadF-type ATPase
MPTVFIGIDLGGSGTRAALVAADGSVLATGRGPTGLLGGAATRPAAGRRHLARALDAALAPIAARAGDQSCVVVAGTRGLSVAGRRESLQLELKTRFPSAGVQVTNDALIGLWAGLAGKPGVAVVAGAGSIALARTAEGVEGRAGGWGYLMGDEGSGYWIGREAILSYLRSLEGREAAGILTQQLAATIKRTSVVDVLSWLYTGQDQVARLADLAPLVSGAARAGDVSAVSILDRAGRALAELAVVAARQVWADGLPRGMTVVGVGGVWAAGTTLNAGFDAEFSRLAPHARRIAPRLPPVGGAVLLAMGADRAALEREIVERVELDLARA